MIIIFKGFILLIFLFSLYSQANSAQILVWHPGCHLGETSKRPEIVVPPKCMLVLLQNPFYANHIRHKTHTSIQNKLNGGNSSSSSPSPSSSPSSTSSENRINNQSQSLVPKQPYSRLIFAQTLASSPSPSSCSVTPGNRCYNGMRHILSSHAKLAQGVMVR